MSDIESTDKISRVLQIYTKLLDGYVVNKAEEAQFYGVNERSIQRDIDDIRGFLDRDSERTGVINSVIYDRAKQALSERERKLIENHLASLKALNVELDQKYHTYLEGINDYVVSIVSLLSLAFAPDVKGAFDGSISLAKAMGVPDDEILDSPEKLFAFFVD